MTNVKFKCFAGLTLIGILACGCSTVSDAHLAADKDLFDAVAEDWRYYYSNDPSLDEKQKRRRDRTYEVWKKSVEISNKIEGS